jgi:sterol desaturase/sphingolipid hydroxylase (fatty acid hydroxylase superfamily)
MKEFIDYFEHIPPAHRTILLLGGLTFFFSLESILPMLRFKFNRWKHAGINLFFTFTTVLVNFCFAFIILKMTDYLTKEHHYGLLWIFRLPTWTFIIIGLLGLDLIGAWLAHFLQHKIPVFWRFHLVHHTDPGVDATTANRHHPGESVIRVLFTMLGVAVMGAPMWLLMLYQSLSVVLSQFNHMNIKIPKLLDTAMSYIIVSPDMHKVHHHYKLPYTNTNYGNIFSFWDRIFGCFVKVKDPRKDLVYGLDTFPQKKEHSNLGFLLGMPFKAYRPPRTAEPIDIEQ